MEWLLDLTNVGWLSKFNNSLLLLVVMVVLVGTVWWWWLRSMANMPPGPMGLPVVGYLPWIDLKAPHLTLSKLVDRYGRVFSLKMGGVMVVVMADPKIIKDTFNLKSTSGRAPLYLTHGIMKGYGLICAEGWLWRDHRKFVAGFMRDHGMRAAVSRADMEHRIHNVARQLTEELSISECPVDISSILLHHVGNTMNQLVFGLTYSEEDPTWRWLRHLLEEGTKLVGVAGPMNFLPWLRFLPMYQKVIRFITKNQQKTHEEYQKIIDAKEMDLLRDKENQEGPENSHQESQQTNENFLQTTNTNDSLILESLLQTEQKEESQKEDSHNKNHTSNLKKELPEENDDDLQEASNLAKRPKKHISQNIIEAYIKERAQRGDDVGNFTYKQLHHVAADLFGAGSETTITTLKWHFLNMALFPQIQKRVQKELDDCVGGSEHVTLDQSTLIPFTLASIMETQRLRSIVPLGIPHGATEKLTIDGYNIPEGTMLLPLLWFVHHDPASWEDPHSYIPDRFLSEEGQLMRQHPAFMPFQTGRRMCIGDEFAKMILFIFTSRILLKFRVSLEDENSQDDPARDPICGISLSPRPFKLIFTPRMRS